MKYYLPYILLFLVLKLPAQQTNPSSILAAVKDAAPLKPVDAAAAKQVSIKDFGAVGDGSHDDYQAIQKACDYVIEHPAILFIPVGNFFISHPITLSKMANGQPRFFTIHIRGMLTNKSTGNEYLSRITCGFKSGYGIGIQFGRGVLIENITLLGQYTFPYKVTNQNIGTLKFNEWADGSVVDTRYQPYAGIVVDPENNANGSSGGSSDITIRNCAIKQWMVGIALTPNGHTLNDEIVNILDDDIEAVRVCIAIGQDQSKTIRIDGLKVWASVHTVVDGVHYGRGTGGGSVMANVWNIAGNVNQLFNIVTDRFPLSAMNIYGESIFRIGRIGEGTGANFINCQIDFLTGPGLPSADYILYGAANFYGGSLRYYDNSVTHRLQLSNTKSVFRDMTLNNPPITIAIYGGSYSSPLFDNVHLYYRGTQMSKTTETLIPFHTTPSLQIDRKKWSGTVVVPVTLASQIQAGDYILGSPASSTRKYYDEEISPGGNASTIQIGRIISVQGDTLRFDDVGLNAYSGIGYDQMYIYKSN